MNNLYTPIFEDPSFLVISKAAGVSFHRNDHQTSLTLKIRSDLNLKDLYPVHRLDIMTSGLLLFAKSRDSARELASLFRLRMIEKYYLALAGNDPKKKQGLIKGDMIKGRNGEWILSRTMEKPAITQFFSTGLGNGLRLYILRPSTGRTHQLRVALKSLGVPALGDPTYARGYYNSFKIDRGYLHAYAIRFEFHGKNYCFTDMPHEGIYFRDSSCTAGLEKFKEPWNLCWPKLRKSE